MKKIYKLLSLILVIALIAVSFCGCGKENKAELRVKSYVEPETISNVDSGVLAENSDYTLSWDTDKYAILLTEKKENYTWSTIPYDYYLLEETEGFGKVNMESPIIIEYIDTQYSQIKEAMGFVEAILNGWISSEVIDNGIRVTYYCTDLEISVPVEYILTDKGLELRLVIEDICEGKNPVYSVSLSPYLCSAKANTDSYLFIPSGSGALMSVDEGNRAVREFNGRVYGDDAAASKNEEITNEQQVNLPVFGVKNNNHALLAVIDEGADIANISAKAGDTEIGYANVYSKFYVRGSDDNLVTDVTGYKTSIVKYTDELADIPYASLMYIPIKSTADYSGMAKEYREYLVEKYSVEASNEFTECYLKVLGAGVTQKDFLGVKYETLVALSTYSDTLKMIKEIETLGVNPVSELIGYGKSGLENGKIAGGYVFARCLGGKKSMLELQDYCNDKKLSLYWNFDVIGFAKSGKGVFKLKDAAKTANGVRAQMKEFYPTVFVANPKRGSSYLIERNLIAESINKLQKKTDKKNISSVSLTTLGNITYSDYSDTSGYAKAGFADLAVQTMKSLAEKKTKISTESPNLYAALNSNHIIGSPIVSSQHVGFKCDVPFYQMVFKGIIPTGVSPINYSAEPRDAFLTAIETGTSLCFSLAFDTSGDYYGATSDVVKFSSYSQWKNTITEYVNESKEYLREVSGATVESHRSIKEGITETLFSNGIKVIVNKTDEEFTSEMGIVDANDFIYSKGEMN